MRVTEISASRLELYDAVPMRVNVREEFDISESGMFTLHPVPPYVKDFTVYERAQEWPVKWDVSKWRFYMAFDGDTPAGAATVAAGNPGMHMRMGFDDACVLWDIRVDDRYKRRGVGQKLLDMAVTGARADGWKRLIIECQNNNVPANRFYEKNGARVYKINRDAYRGDPAIENEIQIIRLLTL